MGFGILGGGDSTSSLTTNLNQTKNVNAPVATSSTGQASTGVAGYHSQISVTDGGAIASNAQVALAAIKLARAQSEQAVKTIANSSGQLLGITGAALQSSSATSTGAISKLAMIGLAGVALVVYLMARK